MAGWDAYHSGMNNLEHVCRLLCDRVAAARADGSKLRIRGGGSKDFYVPQHVGALLDTRVLNGIISYEPSELVVVAGAGTPLHELESALAQRGQYLPFEPPHFGIAHASAVSSSQATVGGMVATALAGPARASVGGVRDYVLGAGLINGLGQHLHFGGQVIKNVAGYDVARLMVGALGTLGILTDVSLKVLPFAPAEATLQFALEQAPALEQLHRWGAQPLPLNASWWQAAGVGDGSASTGPSLRVRLRGARAAVEAACQHMVADVPGVRVDPVQAAADWSACRHQTLAFFRTPPSDVVSPQLWRISVPQTAPVMALPDRVVVEWHGALRWVWLSAEAGPGLKAAARAQGGHAERFTLATGSEELVTGSAQRLAGNSPATALVAQRLKASFDPESVFNPSLSSDAN